MTDAEKAAITEHLATKVCGWTIHRETLLYGASLVLYRNPDGSVAVPSTFSPLTDANDTAMVMEVWQKKGNGLSIDMDSYGQNRPWTVTTNHGDADGACSDAHETMMEAVCVAIYRASKEGARS